MTCILIPHSFLRDTRRLLQKRAKEEPMKNELKLRVMPSRSIVTVKVAKYIA